MKANYRPLLTLFCCLLAATASIAQKRTDKETKKLNEVIVFHNKVVDQFNTESQTVLATLEEEMKDARGWISSNGERYEIMPLSHALRLKNSDWQKAFYNEVPEHYDAQLRDYLITRLTKYEALKGGAIDFAVDIEGYYANKDYKKDHNKKPKAWIDSVLKKCTTMRALKKEVLEKTKAMADSVETIFLSNDPFKDYIFAMKQDMKMSREIVDYINDKKGKLNLEVYRKMVNQYAAKHAEFVALPPMRHEQLQADYQDYMLYGTWFLNKLNEVFDSYKRWGNQVHPSHFNEIIGMQEREVEAYNRYIETSNRK